ncbi:hypothetical protein LCGC14_1814490, partial [marine sediment metagenome]
TSSKQIEHPNIVKFIGFQILPTGGNIILERYDTSLRRAIAKRFESK